ncbi:ATP-dependent helicase, partial [Streptomyces sp. DSM 41886]|nr:ATP-dependent helicase [Streptomyces sp. DSM 41886]
DLAWPLPLDATALTRRRAARDTVLAHLESLAVHGDERPPAHGPGPDGVPPHDAAHEDEPPLEEAPFDEGWDWDALPTERPAETAPDTAPEPVRESAPEAPPSEPPHIPAARHPQEEPADRLTPEEARTLASW